MRTTISIDDDVLAAVKYLAEEKNKSMGAILSELARKGLQTGRKTGFHKEFPVFQVPTDAAPITPAHVKALEDEM